MIGFLLYVLSMFGLAAWMPRLPGISSHSIGLRVVVGFHLIPLLLVGLHAIAGMELRLTSWLLVGISIVGTIKLIFEWWANPDARPALLHPVFVLPFVALFVVTAQGGLGYIPYTGDEFTNWIGAAKQIFASGGFRAAMPFLLHPDFVPGWPLTLVFPMVVIGVYDEGLAAAAPFVLHVTVLAFIFDLVTAAFKRHGLASRRAMLFAWLFVLFVMTAQATGPIWSGDLLIEPTQEIGYTAIFLFILLIFTQNLPLRYVLAALAIILVGQFLFKVTVYSVVPAVALALFLRPFLVRADGIETTTNIREKLIFGSLMVLSIIVPLTIAGIAWHWTSPSLQSLSSPLSLLAPQEFARLLTPAAADLAKRFSAGVWIYITSYKVPLTIISLVGIVYGLTTRRFFTTALAIIAFFATYLIALYWFHLAGLGEYYFAHLNSIERFTRVPIRVLHLMGLLVLAFWVADALQWPRFAWLRRQAYGRPGFVLAVGGMILLGIWNVFAVYRTAVDLKTRQYQTLEMNHINMPKYAAQIRNLAGTVLPPIPKIALIDQQWTLDALIIAHYHAIHTEFGVRPFDFIMVQKFLWEAPPGLPDGELSAEELDTLGTVDLLLPIVIDKRLEAALAARISDPACAQSPTRYFLRPKKGQKRLTFSCIALDAESAAGITH